MNVLTKEQIDIVKKLLLNNKCFWESYEDLVYGKENLNVFDFFTLIRNERALIHSLSLENGALEEIEAWVSDKMEFEIDGDILTNYASDLDENNYVYYRLVARLRSHLRSKTRKGQFNNLLIENEVLAIFKGLIESAYVSSTCVQELRQSAFNFLACSPEAELKIILNSFNPVQKLDDYIDLIAELDILGTMLKNYGTVKECQIVSFEKSSDKMKVRSNRFKDNFYTIILKINSILSVCKDEEEVIATPQFIVLVEQLKALLLSLKESERKLCCNKILESSLFSVDSKFYDFIITYLKSAFAEVEEMAEKVRFYTMCPKKGSHYGK